MILNRTPLSLAQVKSYVKDLDTNKAIHSYLKAFGNLEKANAEKLAAELRALNNHKIREETIVKIIDFCPKDTEDINKIFTDVSLTEEEASAILSIVKNY